MSDNPRQCRADAARERLLEAATIAFADKGFHGATTRDIALAAGMSPAALYLHHRSKEELLYLISRTGHEHTLRLVEKAIESSSDPAESLWTLVHDFAADHAEGHTTARIVNYELSALEPSHLEEIATIRRSIQQSVLELIERGRAAGTFQTADPRMTAVALLSLGIDIARWFRDEGRWRPEDVAKHYADLALRMVGVV